MTLLLFEVHAGTLVYPKFRQVSTQSILDKMGRGLARHLGRSLLNVDAELGQYCDHDDDFTSQ